MVLFNILSSFLCLLSLFIKVIKTPLKQTLNLHLYLYFMNKGTAMQPNMHSQIRQPLHLDKHHTQHRGCCCCMAYNMLPFILRQNGKIPAALLQELRERSKKTKQAWIDWWIGPQHCPLTIQRRTEMDKVELQGQQKENKNQSTRQLDELSVHKEVQNKAKTNEKRQVVAIDQNKSILIVQECHKNKILKMNNLEEESELYQSRSHQAQGSVRGPKENIKQNYDIDNCQKQQLNKLQQTLKEPEKSPTKESANKPALDNSKPFLQKQYTLEAEGQQKGDVIESNDHVNAQRPSLKQEEESRRTKIEHLERQPDITRLANSQRVFVKKEGRPTIQQSQLKHEIIDQIKVYKITLNQEAESQDKKQQQQLEQQAAGVQEQQSLPYYPYSQPEPRNQRQELPITSQIQSQNQGFIYQHEELVAEKSRYSRRSQRLDRQLENEERKQNTQLESPWPEIQKLEWNSQSNKVGLKISSHSEPQSLPVMDVKRQNLKQEVDEQNRNQSIESGESDLRIKELSQIEQAMDRAYPSRSESNSERSSQKGSDWSVENKQVKLAKQECSSVLSFSYNQSQNFAPIKKRQENDSSGYAILSIEESLKKEEAQPNNSQHQKVQNQANPGEEVDRVEMVKEEEVKEDYFDDSSEGSWEDQSSPSKIQQYVSYEQVCSEPKQANSSMDHRASLIQQQKSQKSFASSSKYVQTYEQKKHTDRDDSRSNSVVEEVVYSNPQQSQSVRSYIKQKAFVPKISKQAALEMKMMSKGIRREKFSKEQMRKKKRNKCTINKILELTVQIKNQNVTKQQEKQQYCEESDSYSHVPKISIANQFSFSQGIKIAVQRPQPVPVSPQKFIKEEKIKSRPQFYRPRQVPQAHQQYQSYYKPQRKRYKHRIIEQIYEPQYPKLKGNTKKRARQYLRRQREAQRRYEPPQEDYEQIVIEKLPYEERQIQREYYLPPKLHKKKRQASRKIEKKSRVVDQSDPEGDSKRQVTKKQPLFQKSQ